MMKSSRIGLAGHAGCMEWKERNETTRKTDIGGRIILKMTSER
jgi:hypothetical protein